MRVLTRGEPGSRLLTQYSLQITQLLPLPGSDASHAPDDRCLNIFHPERECLTHLPPPFASSMEGQGNKTKSASQVNLDHFDPEGVRNLSRTLSRSSAQAKLRPVRSDRTLTTDQPFSLENALRAALDRCGNFPFAHRDLPLLTTSGSCSVAFTGRAIPVSRGGSLVYTSGVFAFSVLARQLLIKKPLGRCSTRRSSGRHAGVRLGHHRRERSFMISTAW